MIQVNRWATLLALKLLSQLASQMYESAWIVDPEQSKGDFRPSSLPLGELFYL